MGFPAYDSAQANLQRTKRNLEQALMNKQLELQKLSALYEQEMAKDPNNLKTRIEMEQKIKVLTMSISTMPEKSSQELQRKESTLMKPIIEAVNRITETVAKERGYGYVLDNTSDLLVVMPQGDDLTYIVRERMIAESKKTGPAPKPPVGR